jgi:hypothetical protein
MTADRDVCQLDAAVGRDIDCPGDLCPFWSEDACVIAGLRADLGSNPELVGLLARIRDDLGGIPVARRNPLLPPGLRS